MSITFKPVSITERLPRDRNKNYLTISSDGSRNIRFFNGTRFEADGVTHWLEEVGETCLTAEEWFYSRYIRGTDNDNNGTREWLKRMQDYAEYYTSSKIK